jgi:NTP pyrophosphatase (non-canonical NTP hydrolase)|nr:MAG TPA: NTP-PPase-like protein [Caudoviricetes sp.]
MELNDYQEKAMKTCMPTCNNASYMLLNLVGEVGEFASKVAKHIRKEEAGIGSGETPNQFYFTAKANILTDRVALRKEAGDILWQLAGLCKVMGWDLEAVGQENLAKLAERAKNGTIAGNGDGVTKEERNA